MTFNDKKTKIILCYRFSMNLNLQMHYLLTLNRNFLTHIPSWELPATTKSLLLAS